DVAGRPVLVAITLCARGLAGPRSDLPVRARRPRQRARQAGGLAGNPHPGPIARPGAANELAPRPRRPVQSHDAALRAEALGAGGPLGAARRRTPAVMPTARSGEAT